MSLQLETVAQPAVYDLKNQIQWQSNFSDEGGTSVYRVGNIVVFSLCAKSKNIGNGTVQILKLPSAKPKKMVSFTHPFLRGGFPRDFQFSKDGILQAYLESTDSNSTCILQFVFVTE